MDMGWVSSVGERGYHIIANEQGERKMTHAVSEIWEERINNMMHGWMNQPQG